MHLSLPGRPEPEEARAVVRSAIEAGVTLVDTADVYAVDETELGHNERLIGRALADMGLRADGSEVVVATKGGRTRDGPRWGHDARPEHLRHAVEQSLEALGCERISLYQLHAPDPAVPFAESVGALARLREEGLIDVVGLSNVDVEQIDTARAIVPIASVQNQASVWDMGFRRSPVIAHCESLGIVFLAHSPLGGAERAGKLADSPELTALGDELGTTPAVLALAWLIQEAPVVIPIPGATRPARARANMQALDLHLDPGQSKRLRKACRTLPGQLGFLERAVRKVGRSLGGGA